MGRQLTTAAMKPQTEELLYFLQWAAEPLLFPSWHSLDQSFESWAWHNGIARRLATLERNRLIERHPDPNLVRVVRLTQEGQKIALGGRSPVEQWTRPWDGLWRLVLFDLPIDRNKLRQQFRRTLRRLQFGCLQGSVWLSPDPADRVKSLLLGSAVETDTLTVMEGRPAAGETDLEIVTGAWSFQLLGRRYERYLSFLAAPLPDRSGLPEWGRCENTLWRNAIGIDPLLPQALLPKGYLGREAYHRRRAVFSNLAPLALSNP